MESIQPTVSILGTHKRGEFHMAESENGWYTDTTQMSSVMGELSQTPINPQIWSFFGIAPQILR